MRVTLPNIKNKSLITQDRYISSLINGYEEIKFNYLVYQTCIHNQNTFSDAKSIHLVYTIIDLLNIRAI